MFVLAWHSHKQKEAGLIASPLLLLDSVAQLLESERFFFDKIRHILHFLSEGCLASIEDNTSCDVVYTPISVDLDPVNLGSCIADRPALSQE